MVVTSTEPGVIGPVAMAPVAGEGSATRPRQDEDLAAAEGHAGRAGR
jgi:hypothetical protein